MAPTIMAPVNVSMKKTWNNESGGIIIPCMPKNVNPSITAIMDIISPLPGFEDQKRRLSLTMYTLN